MSMIDRKRSSPYIMQGRVIYVLAIAALIQTLYPITENASTPVLIGFQFLYVLLIVAGILVVRDSPVNFWILVALGLFWIVAGINFAFNLTEPSALLWAYVTIGLYQAMVVQVLLRYIFTTRQVNRDVIYAACAIYLLIGAVFVGIFGTVEILTMVQTGQHAFRDSVLAASDPVPWQHLAYYSFVTLTTMGYGDVLPVTPWARSFATMEAVIGVLYMTVVVARLVGLYASREVEDELAEDLDDAR
ncbi:MAG: two pore domain potassium channel family protein [Anaerolineae bacterium]|nr:two pore domain potassium channel family protein [Anaerolineae bacterium]